MKQKNRHWWIRLIVLLVFMTAAYFTLLTLFATTTRGWLMIDHLYTSIFLITLLIPVAFNDMVLAPRLLSSRRYTLYFTLVAASALAGALINDFLFSYLIDYILPGYYFISYYEFFDLLKFFVVFVAASTLITLSLEWFRLQEGRYRANQLEKEKVTAEFKALASQVNPHFLFNSLTVLYALAVKSSSDTPGAILKLSDILRYVIYQSSASTVSLRSELEILRDFIDLQRYRVHNSVQIDLVESVWNEEIEIAPMLLLPLVENSFKHGGYGESANAFVRAKATEEAGVLHFTIINNKSSVAATPGGFGLKNLKQRLELAYPGRHTLDISETPGTFAVSLQVDLTDQNIKSRNQ
jgi:sensor histidine kinase YesM